MIHNAFSAAEAIRAVGGLVRVYDTDETTFLFEADEERALELCNGGKVFGVGSRNRIRRLVLMVRLSHQPRSSKVRSGEILSEASHTVDREHLSGSTVYTHAERCALWREAL